MKLKCKKALSILLVIIFMLTIVSTSMQTPAEAANPAIAIEGISLIVWVLGLLGITFASTGAQYEAGQQAYNDIPEFKLWVDNNTQYVNPTTGHMTITKNALAELVTTVISKLRAYFSKSKTSIELPTNTYTYYDKVKYTTLSSFSSAGQALTYGTYNMMINDSVKVTVNNVVYEYTVEKDLSDGRNNYFLRLNGSSIMATSPVNMRNDYSVLGGYLSNFNAFISIKYGFRLAIVNNISYLMPFIAYSWTDKSGLLHSDFNAFDAMNLNQCIPLVTGQSIADTTNLPYSREIDYSDAEFDNALKNIADSLPVDGSISVPIDDPNWDATHGKTEVENPDTAVPAVPTTNWAEIWDALGIKDLIKTLTQNKPVTIEESDFKAPQLPTSIIDKFPFCVPFDLIAIVQTLNAPPVAPSFTIPMRFDSINYTENFTIDLSGNDWNRVGKVIRWGNTLLFLAGLILITRKVIQA